MSVGLTESQLDDVFPFHFRVGPDLIVLRVGRSLPRLDERLVAGVRLDSVVHARRPSFGLSWAGLAERVGRLLVLEIGPEKVLRGQVVGDPSGQTLTFLGSPWVLDPDGITALGLSVKSFAIHDPVVDLLQVVATQRATLQDLEVLTAKLRARAEALRRASRAQDEMLAAMSHELRTPLTSILGLCETLVDGIYGPLDSRQRGALSTIETSGRQLLTMIDDLLDLSRLSTGSSALELRATDPAEVADTALARIRTRAESKGQRLRLDVPRSLPVIWLDPFRIGRMLDHLLDNAVKFTPTGGTLSLSAMPVNDGCRFVLDDDGPGIDPALREKVFEPFVQADARMAREHGGAGLGLSLVRRIVDLHGGRVTIGPAPGGGTRVVVRLPAHVEPPSGAGGSR